MDFHVKGMYFSGTGTTRKVVTTIATKMVEPFGDIEIIDFTLKESRDKAYAFDEKDIVIFGVPVIAGRVPNVLLKFLSTIVGGGAMAVPVVLYGNRNFDDGLIELRNILEDRGFHTIAAAAFIGEHSFSRKLAAGRPDNKDLAFAREFAMDVSNKIMDILAVCHYDIDGLQRKLKELGPISVDGCTPLRDYYKPRDRQGNFINILKVKPLVHEGLCTKCGTCVSLCPMGSIDKGNPGVVTGICIKCCGCVKGCPHEALYYDDKGYLYHKEELEIQYAERQEPTLYVI